MAVSNYKLPCFVFSTNHFIQLQDITCDVPRAESCDVLQIRRVHHHVFLVVRELVSTIDTNSCSWIRRRHFQISTFVFLQYLKCLLIEFLVSPLKCKTINYLQFRTNSLAISCCRLRGLENSPGNLNAPIWINCYIQVREIFIQPCLFRNLVTNSSPNVSQNFLHYVLFCCCKLTHVCRGRTRWTIVIVITWIR